MVGVLEFEQHWDTFTVDVDVNRVEPIEVESHNLSILLNLARSEDDGDLELLLGKEHLARRELNIKEGLLLEVAFDADG